MEKAARTLPSSPESGKCLPGRKGNGDWEISLGEARVGSCFHRVERYCLHSRGFSAVWYYSAVRGRKLWRPAPLHSPTSRGELLEGWLEMARKGVPRWLSVLGLCLWLRS